MLPPMYVSIGGPIFLIALGAIIRYALDVELAGIDLDVIGLILMIAGIVTLLLSLGVALFNSDRDRPPPPPDRPPPPRR